MVAVLCDEAVSGVQPSCVAGRCYTRPAAEHVAVALHRLHTMAFAMAVLLPVPPACARLLC